MSFLSRRLLGAPLLALLVLFAGCLGTAPGPGDDAIDPAPNDGIPDDGASDEDPFGGNDSEPDPSPGASGAPGNGTDDNTTNGGSGDNTTDDNETGNGSLPEPEWAPLSSAKIRPGIKLYVDNPQGSDGYCTSNFVYRSPVNNSVYIGMAAHCTGNELGAVVYNPPDTTYVTGGRGDRVGVVVYSSWVAIGFVPQPSSVGDDMHYHDFALVRVDDSKVSTVNPSVLHYGGPTALGDYAAVNAGARVIAYGNTPLRPGPEQADWQEGIVTDKYAQRKAGADGYIIETMMSGAIQGDSGSGLMTKDGKAIGVLSFITTYPPASTGYSSVPHAVAYLNDNGWPIELVTAELITKGLP